MKRLGLLAALVATLAIAAPVSARAYISQSPGCGEVTITNAVKGRGVDLSSSTFSHADYHFTFRHSGTLTFAVEAGGYSYQMRYASGRKGHNGFVVVGC